MERTAMITGASSGIGCELAHVFAEQGYDLVLIDNDIEGLKDVAAELRDTQDCTVYTIAIDLTLPNACENTVEQIKGLSIRPQVLVNDAGIGTYGLFHETPWVELEKMMMLNMLALTHLTWLMVPSLMEQEQAYILNLGSIASFQPGPLMAVYYATKAYVLSFSEALRYELKDTRISVSCLCPPQTETKLDDHASMQGPRVIQQMSMKDARTVAETGFQALMRGDDIVVPGLGYKIQSLLPRFMPMRTAALSKKTLEPVDEHEREEIEIGYRR